MLHPSKDSRVVSMAWTLRGHINDLDSRLIYPMLYGTDIVQFFDISSIT